MKLKQRLILVYLGIGVLFALYQSYFGVNAYKGFAYNLGAGLVWPVTVFPSLGGIIGSLVIGAFVVVVLALG